LIKGETQGDQTMPDKIFSYRDLRVFQNAMEAALKVHELTKEFPSEEKYSLTAQIRGATRSVCTCLAAAWRKRREKEDFIAKLSDSESRACEAQVWVEFARKCDYLDDDICDDLDAAYDLILGQLFKMMNEPYKWLVKKQSYRQTDNPRHEKSAA
jgi:four helix bundle protein